MKNLINMIALIFGIGQSQSQPNVYHHYYTSPTTKTVYHNGKLVSHEVIKTPPTPKTLTKKEFVAFMASKNIICL